MKSKYNAGQIVRQDGKGNIEFYNSRLGNWEYWIPENDLMTRRGLIRMIEHMSEKNWISTEHIHQMIDISNKLVK